MSYTATFPRVLDVGNKQGVSIKPRSLSSAGSVRASVASGTKRASVSRISFKRRHCVCVGQSADRPDVSTKAQATSSSSGGVVSREVLSGEQRAKIDSSKDSGFYAVPRFVTHVDDSFLATLTELYRQRIKPGSDVLDLMSSWVSHLPKDVAYGKVVGHGMNAAELKSNPQLDEFFVRDLNESPGLAAEDGSYDAVTCCVSVQYMQNPEKVFAEIYRVLRPGGVCIMSFSNRMFYEKAVAAWREGTGFSRAQLVKQYFGCVPGFTEPEAITELQPPNLPGPLATLQSFFSRASGDPFYAVVAYRNFKPVEAAAEQEGADLVLGANASSVTDSDEEEEDPGREKMLRQLDEWSYRLLSFGFPTLTLGIISGAVWANEAWGSYWSWDPKETWALITWLVFATYLHTRVNMGWKGKESAVVASIGLVVVFVCYLGVNLFAQGLHSYGWFTSGS